MPAQQIFLIVAAIGAALLVVAGVWAVVAERRAARAEREGFLPAPVDEGRRYAQQALDERSAEDAAPAQRDVVRIVWWVTIVVILVGVGLSGAYADARAAIYALGGAAVLVVLALRELLPAARRWSLTFVVEILAALALTTGLILVTGAGASPFFFVYAVIAVAAALARGGRVALLAAGLASGAYVAALVADPARASYEALDLLRFGINIGSIWLLTYIAAVFAGQERRHRARVLELSRTDPLTGVLNRSQIFGALEQEVSRTRRSERGFCLLMLDLDGLKVVNDTLGHHRGDEVLRTLGSVIRRSIRTVDSAYRYGGDEFVVLLPETDIPGAFVVAEKIRLEAEEIGMALGDGEPLVSVSIGLVSHPEDGATADELMIAADRAMYQAKALGKNQISGNPRPRRLLPPRSLPPAPMPAEAQREEPIEEPVPPAAAEAPTMAVEEPPALAAVAMSIEEPVAVSAAPGPVSIATTSEAEAGENHEEAEPDPSVVRRQIAAARRSFDPDEQIRRAMDAFLSVPRDPRRGPDA